jgi:VanZ family protein
VTWPSDRVRRLAWIVAVAYACVIFYLSTQTNPLPTLTAHVWDKLLHLIEYGGLGLLLGVALQQQPQLSWRDVLFWTALAGFLYGGSDELHQSFVPGRDAEVGDMLADTLGCFLGGAGSLPVVRWLLPRVLVLKPAL